MVILGAFRLLLRHIFSNKWPKGAQVENFTHIVAAWTTTGQELS